MPSKAYLARVEARQQLAAEQQRRRLYTALSKGLAGTQGLTHTVQFHGQPVTITDLEYLWLLVRGHLSTHYHGDSYVTDTAHIHLKEHPHGT